MTKQFEFSKPIIEALVQRNDKHQWEVLIAKLLRRLELDPTEKKEAEVAYNELGNQIAQKLNVPRHNVVVFPQGSMRTQTTIDPRHPKKFDLDIVVKLDGPGYERMGAEDMFSLFGKSLEGNETVTGKPKPKRRCWRLEYPNKPFYFDVTPAVEGASVAGAVLRVRDPDTVWSPTNPEEFAQWFCDSADKRFVFEERILKAVTADAKIEPLPQEEIELDDLLRRTVQIMKLHRDNLYHAAPEKQKDAQPISVIIVTLATHAYENLLKNSLHAFHSPLEAALALVEAMPNYVHSSHGEYFVFNPVLPAENFADRWNHDGGVRAAEFARWHNQLTEDLAKLLHQSSQTVTEANIREVFGAAGVEAWKATRPTISGLGGIINSARGLSSSTPTAAIKPGSGHTLG